MKDMKRILVILMVLVFALSILGCASDKNVDDSKKDDTSITEDKNDEDKDVEDSDNEVEDVDESNIIEKIQNNKKVIWGTNAAFAPFEMREGDDIIGIDADIAAKIAEKLGVELVSEDMEFDSLMAALQSGKIDFIAAGFTVKPDREKQVLFTDNYFKAVQVIMIQETNTEIETTEDLKGKKIGVQNGTSGDFVADDIEDSEVVRYNNGIEAAMDLKNGNIDAVIIDNLPAQMLVDSNPGLIILEDKPDDDEEYALAVRKEDTDLQKLINEVLKEMIDSGEIDQLVNKYSIGE
ncbi:MAG TPA: transporter substrate-binding domain-containing protein [Clostridia bacterium]|nr:transporter substrate-binding domain-containing protein [Clostridia bacterium]